MATANVPLILASGSPRRVALLAELGVPFQTVVSDAPETSDPRHNPEAQAVTIAERKARTVASQFEGGIVLGADTIVVLDGDLLGKPIDDADATSMLHRLSGREHRVVTGVAVVDAATGSLRTSAVTSMVGFRALTDREIAEYVATGEPSGKAGAYAIQGIGARLISTFNGCFANVVGLPLCATAGLLRAADVAIDPTWPGCRMALSVRIRFDRRRARATKSSLGVTYRDGQQCVPLSSPIAPRGAGTVPWAERYSLT
jgi:septum formation protein